MYKIARLLRHYALPKHHIDIYSQQKRSFTILLIIFLFTTPVQSTIITADDKAIEMFYTRLDHTSPRSLSARLEYMSAQFLGKPYALSALGEGRGGKYDQRPLYRLDAFDCETYVDTVLALTLATHLSQFKQCINHIRYRDGHVSFIHRNHFTCLDWNKNNQQAGFIKDITTQFHNKNHRTVTKIATAIINKPAWYAKIPIDRIHIAHIDSIKKEQRLQALRKEGKHLPIRPSHLAYIPLTALFDSKAHPNHYLFNQIPNGAIIEIVRPNWMLHEQIGTNLNVSHLGFAFWQQGQLLFRQASSLQGKVTDIPLIAYLRDSLKSPTIKGINVQIVTATSSLCTFISNES